VEDSGVVYGTDGAAGGTADAGVSSSPEGGYPEGSIAPASATVNVLSYRVVDAKQSVPLHSLVMVSDTPSNSLHIYDVSTASDRSVALPAPPVAVAVDRSGLMAAVAYDAHVSWVDLTAGALKTTCAVSSDAYDVALSQAGVAYVMPRTDQWIALHAVTLSTCVEAASGGQLYAAEHLAMHPGEQALFAADQGLSPSRINRCDLSSSPIACSDAEGSADWGTRNYCGNLWISSDGRRIYSACGATLLVPGNVTQDVCTYGGSLSGVSVIQHLSEAPLAQRVALIPAVTAYTPSGDPDANADTVVRVHETAFLGVVAQYELPLFPLAGSATAFAHGRFVFATPSMDHIYAIVKADPSSGALANYAIATIAP
jgi:hypothetical protein